jgi:hypothetical protein
MEIATINLQKDKSNGRISTRKNCTVSKSHEQQKLPLEAIPNTKLLRLFHSSAKWLLREYTSWQQRPKLLTTWKPILQTAECSNDSTHALSKRANISRLYD